MKSAFTSLLALSFALTLMTSLSVFAAQTTTTTTTKTVAKGDSKKINRKVASEEVKCATSEVESIGIDPDYIEKQVKASGSCYEASHIVESCGAGSSLDSMTTSYAITACDKFTGRLTKPDAQLKAKMEARCTTVCNPRTDGTMCISQQAYCRLDVSKFINSVASKAN